MSNAEIRGRFVWHELMTTDPQGAGAFYSKVLPWKTQPSGMPDYTLWVAGKTQTGGLMPQPEDARRAGAPPSWLIYIGTPDVDATAAEAQRLGGKVLKPPADIPGIGRFAVLADPQCATFAIFTPGGSPPAGGGSPAPDFSWHELATSDHQGALAFYSELFGWSRGPAHDMGPDGTYQLVEHGGTQVAGVFKLMDTSKPPRWLTYIRVASVDRAAAAAKAAGGKVTQGPMEVPGGSRIAQILDPQGGAFAVHELAKQASAKSPPAEKPAAAAKTAQPTATATAKRRPAARKRAAAKRPAARKSPARPAKRAAAKAKKRPAAKRSAKKKAAGKRSVRKAAAKKSAKRSARKPARRK